MGATRDQQATRKVFDLIMRSKTVKVRTIGGFGAILLERPYLIQDQARECDVAEEGE